MNKESASLWNKQSPQAMVLEAMIQSCPVTTPFSQSDFACLFYQLFGFTAGISAAICDVMP